MSSHRTLIYEIMPFPSVSDGVIYAKVVRVVDNYKIGRMGGFRSQPLTVKDTEVKELTGVTYAVSSMCGMPYSYAGWRQYMEDTHICTTLSDKKTHLFAVFDGHGGTLSLIFRR